MTTLRFGPAVLLAASLAISAQTSPPRRSAEAGAPPGGCAAYSLHLRRARAYLATGDRAGALAQLREARRALDACAGGEVVGDGLAAGRSFSDVG